MEDYITKRIFSGVVLWATTFVLIRRALPRRSFSFCNRIVSTIHASIAVSLSVLTVQNWSCPLCPLASKSSHLQMKTLAISLSYMIYDSICCQFDKHPGFDNTVHHVVSIIGIGSGLASQVLNLNMKTLAISLSYMIYDSICCQFDKHPGFDNTVHHVVSIIGIGSGLAYERCGSEMVAALWITEISSPFLHMREILKELGYKDTDLNLAFDILFAVFFSLARMVGGPYLTYLTLMAENPILVKMMALGLQLVSVFWFYKIVRMVRYKLSRRMASKKPAKVMAED